MVYHAQRSYYEALLRAGVKIWMYKQALHPALPKSLTIDDEVAIIGSSNMDMRSFGLNMEISMFVRGEEFVREMRGVEDRYRYLLAASSPSRSGRSSRCGRPCWTTSPGSPPRCSRTDARGAGPP